MPINFFHEVHVTFNSITGEFEVMLIKLLLLNNKNNNNKIKNQDKKQKLNIKLPILIANTFISFFFFSFIFCKKIILKNL